MQHEVRRDELKRISKLLREDRPPLKYTVQELDRIVQKALDDLPTVRKMIEAIGESGPNVRG